MIIAGTGHRFQKLGVDWIAVTTDQTYPVCAKDHKAKSILNETVAVLEDLDASAVISGFATGFDQLLAIAAIEYLMIPCIAAIPFEGQDEKWNKSARWFYRKLLDKCEAVTVVSPGGYADWKYHRRDEWLVDNCEHLIACWDGSPSGTAYTRDYAVSIGRPVTNIWLKQWEK